MSRTSRFVRGLGVGYLNQVLVTVVGLWLTPFLLARLGQHDYGLWLVSLQGLAYLSLLDLGVVALLPRDVASSAGVAGTGQPRKAASDLVGTTVNTVLVQWPVVVAAAATGWWLMPTDWQTMRGPAAAVLAVFAATFPFRILSATLQGLQDLAFLGSVTLVTWMAGTIVSVWLLVSTDSGLYSVAAGWAGTQLASAGLWWWRLSRSHAGVLPPVRPDFDWDGVRGRLAAGSWVSVAQVAQIMLQATDLILLAWLVGPHAVVPYSVTKKLIDVLANQPQMVMQAAMPGLAEVRGRGDRAHLKQVASTLRQAMLLMTGGVVVLVFTVNQAFVSWWVSPSVYLGDGATAWLLALLAVRQLNVSSVYTTFCFGHERRISVVTLADGLATVLASVLLVMFVGPMGVVYGSFIGVLLVGLPRNVAAELRETGESIAGFVLTLLPIAGRLAVVLAAAWFAKANWAIAGPAHLILASSIAALVYLLSVLSVLRSRPLGPYLRRQLPWLPAVFVSGR